MPIPNWEPALSLGDDEIDEQHRELLNLARRICDHRPPEESVVDAIAGLMEYAANHFSTEEGLMRSVDYPNISVHSDEHRKFEARMMTFADEAHVRGHVDWDTLTGYVATWIESHLMIYDADLRRHVV